MEGKNKKKLRNKKNIDIPFHHFFGTSILYEATNILQSVSRI